MDKNPLVRGASQYLATLKEAQEHLKDNQILMVEKSGEYNPADGVMTDNIVLFEYEDDINSLKPNGLEISHIAELYLPSKINGIPQGFCVGAVNLEVVILPSEWLYEIAAAAFGGCSTLKNIELPETLQVIGPEAFAGCKSLDLVIPDTVAEIGEDAFAEVPHITYHGSAEGAPWGAKSMN